MRGRIPEARAIWLVAVMLCGCVSGDDGGGGAAGEGPNDGPTEGEGGSCAQACGDWDALGARLGCSGGGGCECEARCADQMASLIACLGEDTSQCHCESDGDLNCEGGWKDNEGPAGCVDVFTTFATCVEQVPASTCAGVGDSCASNDCCEGLACESSVCQPL